MRSVRAFRLGSVEAFKRDVILGLWLLRVNVTQIAARHSVTVCPELFSLFDELCSEDVVEYSDSTLSLAGHQRFDAGQVMRRLADLNTRLWGTARFDDQESCYSDAVNQNSAGDHVMRLDAIARMARRDPSLFNSLRIDPDATLKRLGYDLSEVHIRMLIDAIHEEQILGDSSVAAVRHMWTAIRQEHVRR